MKNQNTQNGGENDGDKPTAPVYLYICIAAAAACIATFIAALCVANVYLLIASVLCALVAVWAAESQKKQNNFKNLIIFRIISYVLLAVTIGLFIGGIIYSAV